MNWFEKCKCGEYLYASDHHCRYSDKDLMIKELENKNDVFEKTIKKLENIIKKHKDEKNK